ncbi:hypothetical protein H5079_04445 [Pseudoalteromonas sp. SG44-5]|uniref:hypothetical protein n=1 Tax=Pseudoalteromonas sp. SG44-5 TaxID=2760960 RepID=UPI0015FA5F59|nr:hypothetical protein [Pseudoalteromonas sp. SG44-5]MBB1404859.1 hypothetical protein [Pseudoalteromonas sp. SG44-5]
MGIVKKVSKWLVSDWFKVQEDKALHENRLFWLVVLAPLLFIAWFFYRLTEELITKGLYNPHVSAESLAGFVSYYAFPIALLTVPLTLAVMINRFHSSKQKAKSNHLVEQNNSSNNFFNHYKYFVEHCEALKKRHPEDSFNLSPERLYKILFPSSSVSNFTTELNSNFIKDVSAKFNSVIESYSEHVEEYHIAVITTASNVDDDDDDDDYHDHDHYEVIEVNRLNKTFYYSFYLDGFLYKSTLYVHEDLEKSIISTFTFLYSIICFNGVSDYQKYRQSLDELLKETIKQIEELDVL